MLPEVPAKTLDLSFYESTRDYNLQDFINKLPYFLENLQACYLVQYRMIEAGMTVCTDAAGTLTAYYS